MQQDTSDCGVACLLSIIQYYGGENTLEQLRKPSGPTRQGPTLFGLYQAALQMGFNANGCESDIQSLIDHGSPVILHLRIDDKMVIETYTGRLRNIALFLSDEQFNSRLFLCSKRSTRLG
ncbi:MAG: hypothetical protein LBS04_01155 [Tannerellaceae bacterium]|nr:hypothetical protein [Tannerellaceae bacterium]